jgi:hypothetical protein
MQITRNPAAKRPAARPPTPPSITPVKRRAAPPGKPRVRKQGFKPFLIQAAARVRLLKGETFLGQFYRVTALLFVIGMLSIAGVWMANEAEHKGAVALAAYDWCSQPRPLSHVSACEDFKCLASINEDNARYVRICHPEALS